ncbi:MAG: hypothetical protein MZV64_18455 [Ignavibacteriales bacterium]|nr:hypothetical protein [Ignavibacteriales bacterium]
MKSLIQFFEENVEKFSTNIYLWEKPQEKYEGTITGGVRRQVHEFGAGLMQMGVKKGDRISLLSEGRNSWVVGEWEYCTPEEVNAALREAEPGRDQIQADPFRFKDDNYVERTGTQGSRDHRTVP